jgi:hypothetical protein
VNRRRGTYAVLACCLLLLGLRIAGVADWGARAAGSLLLATLIIRWGLASMRPMQVRERSHEPVDVVEPDGLPVYTCKGCGTQLLLLRKGNERPPKHCGEAMAYAVVPHREPGDDEYGSQRGDLTAGVPDYLPDDLR